MGIKEQGRPQARNKTQFGELCASLCCPALFEGEGIDLRMTTISESGQHIFPRSLAVHINSKEVARVDPPLQGHRRFDAPLDLTGHIPKSDGCNFQVTFDADGSSASSFIACVVRTAPRRAVHEMLNDCTSRPAASIAEAANLWSNLRHAEAAGQDQGVEVATPWLQPLECPLTRERLQVPARGRQCQHLQCFDLEAYISTSLRAAFHRRWRCPVCDHRLPLSEVVVCDFTRQLLRHSGGLESAELEPAFTRMLGSPLVTPCHTRSCPGTAKTVHGLSRSRRRWRRGVLHSLGGKGPITSGERGASGTPSRCATVWGIRLRGNTRDRDPVPMTLD